MIKNPFKMLFLALVCSLLGISFLIGVESYSCDPSVCKPPKCFCSSKTFPNLTLDQIPQFVMFTFDDSVQQSTISVVNQLLGSRKNPNGCPIKTTYYVSIQYTNHSMVTEWYANGHEVADHTVTHVPQPSEQEITNCKLALNNFAGLPNAKISGFRAPFLNYSVETFEILSRLGFQYDSSVTALREDASWPYTLDYGLAHDCTTTNICDKVVHPGFFEIPMAAIIDEANIAHLMDPYLDGTTDTVKKWLQDNFNYHTHNGKTPFGLYIHPVQLAIPGRDNASLITMLEGFLDWAIAQPDVWFVTSQQLITWMQNPVPASQLKDYAPFKCQAPKIDKKICNGLTDDGLLETCSFPNGSWSTCYGCPSTDITLNNPVPPTTSSRHRLPNNCDTVWWDPVQGSCLCTDSSCAYVDTSVPLPTKNSTNNNSAGSNNSNPTSDGKSDSNGQKSDASSLLSNSVLMIGLMAAGLLQFL